jgi:energy-coupling factor transporter transmembrane protein EcfT
VHTEKSLATLLAETREELKEFVITRVGILKAEVEEKIRTWKYIIPVMLIAAALLWVGFLTLSYALIALIAGLFAPSPFAWLWGALIVGGCYLALGIAVGWFAYSEISQAGIAPTRTLKVLKQDQVWLQNEARTI